MTKPCKPGTHRNPKTNRCIKTQKNKKMTPLQSVSNQSIKLPKMSTPTPLECYNVYLRSPPVKQGRINHDKIIFYLASFLTQDDAVAWVFQNGGKITKEFRDKTKRSCVIYIRKFNPDEGLDDLIDDNYMINMHMRNIFIRDIEPPFLHK